jgi:hypothetical protein
MTTLAEAMRTPTPLAFEDFDVWRGVVVSYSAILLANAWPVLRTEDGRMAQAARLDGGKFSVECTLDGEGVFSIGLVCATAGGKRKPLRWPAKGSALKDNGRDGWQLTRIKN